MIMGQTNRGTLEGVPAGGGVKFSHKFVSENVFEYENGHNSAPPGTYGAENLHAGISRHAGLDSDSPRAPNLAKNIFLSMMSQERSAARGRPAQGGEGPGEEA